LGGIFGQPTLRLGHAITMAYSAIGALEHLTRDQGRVFINQD
jgi:hypothetical protein